MVNYMLEKIAAICTITSFLLGVYTTFTGNPEWQRYSLFGFAFLCSIVLLAERKHKSSKIAKPTTLKGAQLVTFPHDSGEVEVFYPQPFKYTPNLTIRFPKKIADLLRAVTSGPPMDPLIYRITEQRPDGFKLRVHRLGSSKPVIKWQAEGLPKH